jgi:hypothetical protein
MAGHYLATTNPEAAAAIGQERAGNLPEIGDWVLYYPTPGEMPGGTDRFPMLVMHVGKDGMVFGIAIAGINDERDVRAFRRSVESPTRAWDWPRANQRQGQTDADASHDLVRLVDRVDDAVETAARGLDALEKEMTEYRDKLDEVIKQSNELERKIAEPDRGADIVEDQLMEFARKAERRLARLEQELGLDDKPKPQRVATPPAHAAHKPAAKSKRKSKR